VRILAVSNAPAPVKNVSTRSKVHLASPLFSPFTLTLPDALHLSRSQIKQDGLTDSQREKQHLDSLFEVRPPPSRRLILCSRARLTNDLIFSNRSQSAKADEDSEEDEAVQPVRASHRIEQDDDEW